MSVSDREAIRQSATTEVTDREPPPTDSRLLVVEGPAADSTPDRVPPKTRRKASLLARWFTYLLVMPAFLIATTVFGLMSLLTSLWDRGGEQQHQIARLWARTLLRLALSPVRVIGAEHLQPGQAAVYAANHLSYMDTPVLFAKLPFQFRILAKQSLWKTPFIGWHLHRSGQVPVDQSSARSSIASLSRGVSALKAGTPLVLFPEGGRAASAETQPFLSGAAFMAIRAQVPLVPLTIVGTYELLPIHTYHVSPRPLLLVIGEPLATAGLTTRDADTLTQKAYQAITITYMHYSGQQPGPERPQSAPRNPAQQTARAELPDGRS